MEQVWHRKRSGRLFDNDALELVSKVHPSLPFVVFLPVSLGVLGYGLQAGWTTVGWTLLVLPLGVVVWQVAEYVIHRFAFHWEGVGPVTRRLHHIIHGYHHLYPDDPMRLVMPLSVSVPLAALLGLLLWSLGVPRVTVPFFSGFVLAYLGYDFFHWFVHAYKPRRGWARRMHTHHMIHHFKDPEANFGISHRWVDRLAKTVSAGH